MALPTGLIHRWRADDITGVTSGGSVSSWPAATGGANLTQGTAGSQPTFRTGGLNGHSYVDFPGGRLLTSTAAWTGPGTVMLVLRYAPGDGTERIVIDGDTGSAVTERIFIGLDRSADGVALSPRLYSGSSVAGAYLTMPDHFVVTASHGASGQAYLNGDQAIAPSNTGVGNPTGIILGADNAGGRTFVGHVYEVIVWDHILTGTERADAHTYVQDTYGIAVADYVTPPIEPDGTMPALPWDSHPGSITTLAEETDFLAALAAATDRVRVVQLGSSAQGRPLRAVIVGPPRSRDQIRAARRYMVLGSHHGDEWAGREATFKDMRDHAIGGGDETVIYLPTVNPDSVNTPLRELANGIDPNRLWSPTGVDQTTNGTAYQPEQQAVRQAILLWRPLGIVDTHEYDTSSDGTGTTYRLDPGTTNATGTPQATIDAVQGLLSEIRAEATDYGHTITNYTGSIPNDGGTQAWKLGGIPATFTESPRLSSGGLTLRRAQQLTSLDAARRYARANGATLAALATAVTWWNGYTPTVQDNYVPTARGQATLVAVARAALAGSGTSITIPRPQGVQAGDLLIAVAADATETVATEPTGWSPLIPMAGIDFGPNMYVMSRRADGTEPAGGWAWTVPSVKTCVLVMAWRGVDTTTPLDVTPVVSASETAWPAAPSITTVTPNATVLSFAAGIGPSGDTDLRWTSDGDEDVRITSQAAGTTNPGVVSHSRVIADPGAVTPSVTAVETLLARGAIVALALRPAAVAAAPTVVVDSWNGTQLVRQQVDAWNGTQLVRQALSF